MNVYFAEFLGTAILILLGCGVNANVLLSQTKGNNSGWLVVCTGWGLAVYVAVLCVGDFSGAHINPAVTIGLTLADKFYLDLVPGYIAAQMAGAITGAILVYLFFKPYFDVTEDPDMILGTFGTAPNIRSFSNNFYCEVVATFVLVYAVLMMADPSFSLGEPGTVPEPQTDVKVGLGSIGALRVGLIVFVIGLGLGGTTGYSINPARDLGPRIAHAILPIRNKGGSDWSYAPIPFFGPIAGGILAAVLYRLQ